MDGGGTEEERAVFGCAVSGVGGEWGSDWGSEGMGVKWGWDYG